MGLHVILVKLLTFNCNKLLYPFKWLYEMGLSLPITAYHTFNFPWPFIDPRMRVYGPLNSLHQQIQLLVLIGKAYLKIGCMELNKAPDLTISTCHIRRSMTNTSPTVYCLCWVTALIMLQRLKSTVAVFVFEQLDYWIVCVLVIHARRTNCKDYIMNCLPVSAQQLQMQPCPWLFLTQSAQDGCLVRVGCHS